jgi:chromosome segregation ATPase
MGYYKTFMAGCAALALAGCKTDISEITDDQLLSLLGNGSSPAQITEGTRECVEVLGGVNEAVYRDVPGDVMGMMKTECRKQLQGWLDDPRRNSTELQVSDFDREDLAQRIIALDDAQAAERETQREAEEAERAAQREAEAAARIEEMGAELAEVTAQAQELRSAFEARREVLAPACETLRGLREELQAKNRVHSLFNRGLPSACTGETLRVEAGQLAAFEERVASFEIPDANQLMFASVPSLPRIDLEKIDQQIERVEAVTADYRTALSEE